MNSKFWNMLSMAMGAGKLSVGEGRAEDSIKGKKAELIILSTDASLNTEKKFLNMSSFRDIPVIRPGDRYELGNTIGRDFAVVITVCDKNFKNQLLKLFE